MFAVTWQHSFFFTLICHNQGCETTISSAQDVIVLGVRQYPCWKGFKYHHKWIHLSIRSQCVQKDSSYSALNIHMDTITCDTYICHPGHQPVCRSSGTTRTCHPHLCWFWLELPLLLSSFSTVKLFRLPVSHLQLTSTCSTAGGLRASLFPRRGEWLENSWL